MKKAEELRVSNEHYTLYIMQLLYMMSVVI